MENKRLRYSMQILEVVMNFLVIFCLETVVFSSFSNLEGLVGETGALVKAPGILRQLLFLDVYKRQLAGKVIGNTIDAAAQDSLIDETLKEIGDSTWLS